MTRRQIAISIAVGAAVMGVVASAATRLTDRRDANVREKRAVVPRTVVVAELFTSEGCSSCPPADALLRRLDATQPIEGVDLIVLGEHVDYWDRLGWRDVSSLPLFSARQSTYAARVFGSDRVYTPQLVVDGAFEGVASDEAVVRRLLHTAAGQPHGLAHVTLAPATAGVSVTLQVDLPPGVVRHEDAELVVALAEDGVTTHVTGGENSGRTLAHSAVVRTLATVGRLGAREASTSLTSIVPLKTGWVRNHLRVVAFAQEPGSRRILAAAAAPLRSVEEE